MTIENLRYFVEAYKCGSVYQAAKNLFISPQGLSQGLKRMEESLHIHLFYRTQNGLVPTKFGEDFYPRAALAVKNFEDLENFANDYISIKKSNIKMGFLGYNQFSYLILSLVHSFLEENSEAKVSTSFFEQSEYEIVNKKLLNGELDIAWTFHTEFNDAYSYIVIKDQPLKCAICVDNPLSKKPRLLWSDLCDEAFISTGVNELFSELIKKQCEEHGFTPNEKFFTSDTALMANLVDSNQGVALRYGDFMESFSFMFSNTKFLNIYPELRILQSLYFSKEKKMTPLFKAFTGYIETGLKNNQTKW